MMSCHFKCDKTLSHSAYYIYPGSIGDLLRCIQVSKTTPDLTEDFLSFTPSCGTLKKNLTGTSLNEMLLSKSSVL